MLKSETAAWVQAEYKFEITEQLRFAVFDIGRLLIRHDSRGYRNEQWRKIVTELFDDAAVYLKDLALHPKADLGDLLSRAGKYLDYQLPRIGEAVLDPEQRQTYEMLLNRAMYKAMNQLAMRLSLNGRDYEIEPFEWKSSCGTDNAPEYRFEVQYQTPVDYIDGKLQYIHEPPSEARAA